METIITETESSILKQYHRYSAINEFLVDTSLWSLITTAMLDRYTNKQLLEMGSGQTSKSNMIERRVMDAFSSVYTTTAIDHSVTGKTHGRPTPIVPNDKVDLVVDFISQIEF